MNPNLTTNQDLIDYWNLTRGGNKTSLTESEIYQLNLIVKCLEIYPTGQAQPIFVTDAWVDITVAGITYISSPDFMDDSFTSNTERNSISNNGTSFKVSNVNQSYLSLLTNGVLRDAKVNIYLTILNPANGTVLDHSRTFSGYMNNSEMIFDNTVGRSKNECTINLNSVWKKLDRAQPVLSSTSIHQSVYKGDLFFNLIGIVNSEQLWKN